MLRRIPAWAPLDFLPDLTQELTQPGGLPKSDQSLAVLIQFCFLYGPELCPTPGDGSYSLA